MKLKTIIAIGTLSTLIILLIFQQLDDRDTSDSDHIYVLPDDVDIDLSGVEVGEAVPNFELTSLNGDKVKLSDLRGNKIMLNFWATWCEPCRDEMPDMVKFMNYYSDEPVEVYAVTTETNQDQISNFINEIDGVNFPILLDTSRIVTAEYQIMTLPTTYFINSEGILQMPAHIGPLSFEEMVDKMNRLD
ncbi:redoxin domain-containing protein [Halalkalibacillus halophilus]|uniref:redoxin domain-containing protein n=1 Tax=Halalkalibacillus halophilus TaxID=392827 RepID=UPI00042A742B|nr:redoxin domain-containing protein [Halalkalibacillus halophilus]